MSEMLGKWALNEVHHTDALTLMGGLPDNCIDLIVTSPPYDNLRTYNGYSFEFEPIARESYRVLKPGGVLVWVVGDSVVNGSEALTSMRQALYFVDSVGFRMHQRIVWQKDSMPTKRPKAYLPDFEDVFVLSTGEPLTFNPVLRRNKNYGQIRRTGSSGKHGFVYGESLRTVPEYSILTNVQLIRVGFSTDDRGGHPAAFPEALAERHILTWSNPGDVILDYFMGSGTTAKMARNNGRRYIGCDISLEYVELARKRLALPYTPPLFSETPASVPTAEQPELFTGTEAMR